MENVTGGNLIIGATLFGCLALAFTFAPFLIVLTRGIAKANDQPNGGGGYVGVIVMAYLVHLISSMLFMLIMYVLNVFYVQEANYVTGKMFKIFWTTGNRQTVINAVGGDLNSATMGAYTILHAVQVFIVFLYAFLPIIVTVSSVIYAIKYAQKDTYGSNYISYLIYSLIGMLVATSFYFAWAQISSVALFLPSGTLLDMTFDFWREMFKH